MAPDRRSVWRRLVDRLAATLDDSLPMPPDEREKRDTYGLDAREVERQRLLRIKLSQLQKKGKSGYR